MSLKSFYIFCALNRYFFYFFILQKTLLTHTKSHQYWRITIIELYKPPNKSREMLKIESSHISDLIISSHLEKSWLIHHPIKLTFIEIRNYSIRHENRNRTENFHIFGQGFALPNKNKFQHKSHQMASKRHTKNQKSKPNCEKWESETYGVAEVGAELLND